MDRNIFKNPSWDKELKENGYVVLPLLDEQAVEDLHHFFQNSRPDIFHGFHSTSTNNDLNYRKRVHEFIEQKFLPLVDELLIDYESIYGSFVVKEPGQEGNFPFHMDWSMVDEKQYISLAFWTPLIDTFEENGPLLVLEKSHQLGLSYRGGPFLFQALDNTNDLKNKFTSRQLCLKKGEVIIYDHRLFHGSLPNKTNHTRPALNFTVKPKEAQLLHYHQNGNMIEVHQIKKDFFLDYKMGEQPQQSLLKNTIDLASISLLNDQIIYQLVQ